MTAPTPKRLSAARELLVTWLVLMLVGSIPGLVLLGAIFGVSYVV